MEWHIEDDYIFFTNMGFYYPILRKNLYCRYNATKKACYSHIDYGFLELLRAHYREIDGKPILDKIEELLNLSLPQDRANDAQPQLTSFALPLFKHQKESVIFGWETKCFADLSDPGTGKTRVQIELLLQRGRQAFPVLIICPKSIMIEVWKKQLLEAADFAETELIRPGGIRILDRTIADARMLLRGIEVMQKHLPQHRLTQIFIVNYEKINRLEDLLKMINWGTIILDESTRIKNPKAKRTHTALVLKNLARYRSIMTGTPSPKNALDLWGQFNFIDSKIFGDNYYVYRHRYFKDKLIDEDNNRKIWFILPGAHEEIKEKIRPVSIRHIKRECLDLPPLIFENRFLEMDAEQEQQYQTMKREFLIWVGENSDIPINVAFKVSQLIKMRQISSGFVYDEEQHGIRIGKKKTPKLIEVEDLLDELGDEKVIIFIHFRESMTYLNANLANSVFFGQSDKHKEIALRKFEDDHRILIANWASAAHGLNLQFCSNIIVFEPDNNLENYQQGIQRIERIGQKNKMTVFRLCASGAEKMIYRNLGRKELENKKIDIKEMEEIL